MRFATALVNCFVASLTTYLLITQEEPVMRWWMGVVSVAYIVDSSLVVELLEDRKKN